MFHLKKIRTILFIIFIMGILFPAGYSFAQSPSFGVTINYLSASNNDTGNLVTAYVSVLDENGNSITSLTKKDFSILEDGHEVIIDSMTPAVDPMSIILVLDTSGSMAARQPNGTLALDSAKQAAVNFIKLLANEDQVAIYSFNDDVSKLQDLTLDHNSAINAINGLNWKDFGGTCLYDSAYQAIKKASEVQQGRRAIILLTDGIDEKSGGKPGETCSIHTLNDVIDEATLSTSKVPIFTIGFGKDIDEQELLRLASRTGGQGVTVPDGTTLTEIFSNIAEQLKNQYLVSYKTQVASGEHAVVVKINTRGMIAEDERRIFIPVYSPNTDIESVTPVSTVAPSETSDLSVVIDSVTTEGVLDGELSIKLLLEPPDKVSKTAIYIDDHQLAEAVEAPFDQFILKIADIGPGKHIIRVEATNENGGTAIDKRDLTIPDFPTSTVVPTTAPVETTASGKSALPLPLLLLLAIAGAVLLILIIIIALIIRKRNRNGGFTPTPPTVTENVGEFITSDDMYNREIAVDPFKTMDEGDDGIPGGMTVPTSTTPIPPARLVVIEGVNVLKGDSFPIMKVRSVLGRNAGGAMADIDIPDKPVSRLHAEIIFNGQQFTIQDTGSTYGTYVNGNRIGRNAVILHNQAVVGLGTKTRLRFEIISTQVQHHDPDRTMDGDLDDDPFKTSDEI